MMEKTVTCTLLVTEIMKFNINEEKAIEISNRVNQVNRHHHTKTCRRYETYCRFNIPRFPSNYTIIAQTITKNSMTDKQENLLMNNITIIQTLIKEKLIILEKIDPSQYKNMLLTELLEEIFPNIHYQNNQITIENMTFDFKSVGTFYKFISGLNLQEYCHDKSHLRQAIYHYSLSLCNYGTKHVLKRTIQEISINNYNPHWIWAFNANMDIQIPLDYFSIITYISDYITKPEQSTMETLKAVKKQKIQEKASAKETMYALIESYLISREIGETETYYKLFPMLHLKESNIKTIFVQSGFPSNRYKFLRSAAPENTKSFEVEGHDGKFMDTMSIHEKYAMRPSLLETISLAQFVISYSMLTPIQASKLRKELDDNQIHQLSTTTIVVCNTIASDPPLDNPHLYMSNYIILNDGKMMRLRKYPACLRRHKFKSIM